MDTTILLGKLVLKAKMKCKTGLHIGGSTTGVEIGGMENPVIKDPLTDKPYIPGSSLKGKLRSLTEWGLGLIREHSKHHAYVAYECDELAEDRPADPKSAQKWDNALALGSLFGSSSDDGDVRMQTGPTRLIIRDAFVNDETTKDWESWLGKGVYTEVKTENALDRVTAEANPRPLERIPAGSAFDVTMILDVYKASDIDLLRLLLTSMYMLEHSTLGGSGSRGSGQVAFEGIELEWRPVEYYMKGQGNHTVTLPETTLEKLIPAYNLEDVRKQTVGVAGAPVP